MKLHHPRKRFGQHFLHDANVIGKIINSIHPLPTEFLVEIGPGLGALTRPLLKHINHLTLIEIDRDLARQLQEDSSISEKIKIFQQDAMKFDYSFLSDKSQLLRIVGNLPYNISTPLLFHLVKFTSVIQDMHFMLQKEVAQRLGALPRSHAYGRLSVMMQYFCKINYLFDVPPGAFSPPPKVDSAVIRLTPYKELPFTAQDPQKLAEIVRHAFNQRRKTLRNSLHGLISSETLIQCGIKPEARAEELTVQDYVSISNSHFFNKNN
jgi:16S rRNA (adenine1518-N6/adenine1519-N6)-dimethyltransferase